MGLIHLWCLADVTTQGAEGNGTGSYSCAQMSFVRDPLPGTEVWAAWAPSAGPVPRTRAVLRVKATGVVAGPAVQRPLAFVWTPRCPAAPAASGGRELFRSPSP